MGSMEVDFDLHVSFTEIILRKRKRRHSRKLRKYMAKNNTLIETVMNYSGEGNLYPVFQQRKEDNTLSSVFNSKEISKMEKNCVEIEEEIKTSSWGEWWKKISKTVGDVVSYVDPRLYFQKRKPLLPT